MLIPLYSLYLRLCLFRAGAEDIPHSQTVFYLSLGGTLFVAWFSALVLGSDATVGTGLGFGLMRSLLIAGALWLLLGLFGRTARWLQVASGVFGCGAVLSALALPFLLMMSSGPTGLLQVLLWLGLLGFGLWQFAVVVRILRSALESGFGLAVGMAMLLELAPLPLLYGLFPDLLGPVSVNG